MRIICPAVPAAKIFVQCLKEFPNSLGLDSIELKISGMDALIIEQDTAIISVSRTNRLLHDTKMLRCFFFEKLSRIFVKRLELPRIIENLMALRETAKIAEDDYVAYAYANLFGRKAASFEQYIDMSMLWIALHGISDPDAEMLRQLARNKAYESRTKSLFDALKNNLWIPRNMERAVKKCRRLEDAGDKIQVGKLAAHTHTEQRQRL